MDNKYKGFTATQIKEAKSQLKTRENYWVIRVGWGDQLVFPYESGITFLNALKLAEKFDDTESEFIKITPISQDMRTKVLSREEYETYKMRTLLKLEKPEEPEVLDIAHEETAYA